MGGRWISLVLLLCWAQSALAQVDPNGDPAAILTQGVNWKVMLAIGFVSIICRHAKWMPERWEMLVPLGIGALVGVGQGLVAGAETPAEVFNAMVEAVLVNAAAAVVAVHVAYPWIEKYLPSHGENQRE